MRNAKRACGFSGRMTTAPAASTTASLSAARREAILVSSMDALPLGIEEDGLDDLTVAKPFGTDT